jgi:hypothetical protein
MTTEEALVLVHKLISLSSSPSPEEARTAALAACRLIREHKLEVSLPKAAPFGGATGQWEANSDVASIVNNTLDFIEKLTGQKPAGKK